MERKRITEKADRPLSKLKLPSKRRKDNFTPNRIEKWKLSKEETHLTTNSCPQNCSCRAPNKPKYNFSDDSSDEETISYKHGQLVPVLKEQNLKWRGKTLQLKDVKVKLTRLGEDSATNTTEDSSDFLTCVSSNMSYPKEYLTRHRIKLEKTKFGRSLTHSPDVGIDEHMLNEGQDINEYVERNSPSSYMNGENEVANEVAENISIQDNIMKAVQNKNGRKIMSEESEAFFWDWILKKD